LLEEPLNQQSAKEREKWFEFRDGRMEERALKWLESIGVSLIEE